MTTLLNLSKFLLLLLLALPLATFAQGPDRVDSLIHYGVRMDESGDRDGALGYFSRAVDQMVARGQVRSRRFWRVAQMAVSDVACLYGAEKALEVEDGLLAYLEYGKALPDNNCFRDYLQNAYNLAFSIQNYSKSIYYGHWLISQLEASEKPDSQEYTDQCLRVYKCYRLIHRPMDQCYDFLTEYGTRCRALTGSLPIEFVEQYISLDIENNFYASALQCISALRDYYKSFSGADTASVSKYTNNLLQGSRLLIANNQCDKALEYLSELSAYIDERGIRSPQILHNLYMCYGLVYQRTNRFDEALESYSDALRFQTDKPDCYDQQIDCFLQQSSCYEQMGDFLKALTLSNKACRYSSVNKSLKSADLALQSRSAYLFQKAWLGNAVDYQALLDFGNSVADRNDPAITSQYVTYVARVCPKFRDQNSQDFLISLLYRMQTDDISLKLLQIQEEGKYPSIQGEINRNHLIFSLYQPESSSQGHLLYNLCLAYKSAVINSIRRIGKVLENSSDAELKLLYSRAKALKKELTLQSLKSRAKADSVRALLFDEESVLMRKLLERHGNYLTQTSWQDIRNSLADNEIAVEFFDYRRILPSLDYEDGNTYGALVISPKYPEPVYLKLFNDTIFRDGFSGRIPALHSENRSAMLRKAVLEPVLEFAGMESRVYYSPSGIIHNIALENLLDSSGRPAYLDYDFRRLSSTAEIVSQSENSKPQTIALLGDIAYGVSESNPRRPSFRPIPGTKTEVENIARLMKASGAQVRSLSQTSASEESFKNLSISGYDIIHLATHGYFLRDSLAVRRNNLLGGLDDVTISLNPLLRSGLALAGANRAWSGDHIPDGVDDGILTSQEIKDLDLSRTQMVVLSACETGLGDINTDGVFGLQRAFKSAGVQTIVMSLWKVSDNATSLLMQEFYKGIVAHRDRHKAFRQAKEAVRARFPEAYYWAGFVMLD